MNTLPAELQLEILGFALSVPGSAARQRDRLAFRKVCATWRQLLKPWKELEVIGFSQLNKLNVVLGQNKDDKLLVQSIYVELLRKEPKQSEKLKTLLDKLPNLTRVELAVGSKSVSGMSYDSIGNTIAPTLRRLTGITDFTLKAGGNGRPPSMSLGMIHRYAWFSCSPD